MKSSSSLRKNETDNFLTLIIKKKGETLINEIINKREVTTDSTEIQRVMR